MILTCPACDTKYVVKDGAIPPQGRQVRCASCKHSWHQEPEELTLAEPATDAEIDFGGPPPPRPQAEQPLADVPAQAVAEGEIAGEPQPAEESPWGTVSMEPVEAAGSPSPVEPDAVATEEAPAVADEWRAPSAQPGTIYEPEPTVAVEEEFVGYAPIDDGDEEGRRRWPLAIGLILLIAAAAVAFWFFAPPQWKERAGLAQASATPLKLMITTSDRQPLQSGNELVAISGRVINDTNQEQNVPPIYAELRDKETQQVVHRWTIAPPTQVLAPGKSASFNSAEMDVPKGGDELTVTLGANS